MPVLRKAQNVACNTMRHYSIVISFFLFWACTSKDTSSATENDIFIVELDKAFNKDNKLIVGHSADKTIRFSKLFWKFFFKDFPKSSAVIFLGPQYDSNNNYLDLNDTSLTFFNVDLMKTTFFERQLPTNPKDKEKESFSFYIMPLDSVEQTPKIDTTDEEQEYHLLNDVREEYIKLQHLLTEKPIEKHYIIIYKKDVYYRYFSN